MLFPMTRRDSRIRKLWRNEKFLVKKIVYIGKLNKRKEKVEQKATRRTVVLHHQLHQPQPHPDGRDGGMSKKNLKNQRPPPNGPKTRNLQRNVPDGIKLLLRKRRRSQDGM